MNAVTATLLGGGGGGAGGAATDMVFGVATAGSGLFDNGCFNLTKRQRVMGFVACFCLGFVVSCLSTISLYTGKVNQFAIFYTIGNLIALWSTAFLMGPWAQLKAMFHRKRIGATLIYLATLGLTLGVAFGVPNFQSDGVTPTPGKTPGIFGLVLVQFIALVWYTASYIPFARDLIVKTLGWVGKSFGG